MNIHANVTVDIVSRLDATVLDDDTLWAVIWWIDEHAPDSALFKEFVNEYNSRIEPY